MVEKEKPPKPPAEWAGSVVACVIVAICIGLLVIGVLWAVVVFGRLAETILHAAGVI